MKPLLIPVCLAAAAAVAAELKDPEEVARDWKETIEQALESGEPDALKLGTGAPQSPANRRAAPFVPRPPSPPPWPNAVLGPLYDAPSRPPLHRLRLPPEIPDSAIPWLYRGETYWLVPLGGAHD